MTDQPETLQPAAEEETVIEAYYDPRRVDRFVFWARVAARVFLVLTLVGVVLVGWDVFSQIGQMGGALRILRTFVGQFLGFASLFMAVVIFEGIAHLLEILMDIAENTRAR